MNGARFFGTFFGQAIAGVWVFGIWPLLWQTYGVFGGWLAGFVVIGTMWFLNHYVGLTYNPDGAAPVDMAVGIGVAGTVWLIVKDGASFSSSLPTLLFIAIGATLGGLVGNWLDKYIEESQAD